MTLRLPFQDSSGAEFPTAVIPGTQGATDLFTISSDLRKIAVAMEMKS